MDNQVFTLLNDKIESVDKKIDANKAEYNERFDRLENKIDTVLQFRWQMGGALLLVAFLVNLIFKAVL